MFEEGCEDFNSLMGGSDEGGRTSSKPGISRTSTLIHFETGKSQELLLLPHDNVKYYSNEGERNVLLKWFDSNLSRIEERRLTTDNNGRPVGSQIVPMHRDNIKRIVHAYRHPFERIPDEYFSSKDFLDSNE